LDTYQSISRQLPLLAQYQDLFARHGGMEEILMCMFKNIFDFHLRALRFFQAGKWKQSFKAHVFRTKFDDILNDLRQHKELVERQADLIAFREAKQAQDDAQKHYEEHEEQERLRRRLFMQDWLDAPNMAAQQEKGQLTREARPRSGQWLLSRDKVKAWLDPAMIVAACLWIHGIPGAGKTVLASLLIDSCKSITNVRTIYFYCRHGDQRADNFISMARSFLDQLSRLESSIVDILYDMAAKKENCFKTRKDTEELLQLCLDAGGTLYVVVDGLDECAESEQKVIARWLRKYADNSGATREPTRCVFLSQDDTTTRALLSTLPTIRISATDNKHDIKAYCSAIAKDIQSKFTESDVNTSWIVEAVSTKADGNTLFFLTALMLIQPGMFLYAILVLDNLLQQTNLAAMRAELDPGCFPNGLEQACVLTVNLLAQSHLLIMARYGRILKRILDTSRPAQSQSARKILAWLVCAMRPFRWREIQCAISTDPDASVVDPDQRLVMEPKEICGSLVETHCDESLRLVHTTAKL
jgi:adenylate kinase family enzyme